MKILLIGKTGQLGGDILRNGSGHRIEAHDERTLDITAPDAVRTAMSDIRPDVVINTAAFHNVPLCETDFASAFRVNCAAVRDLARACEEAGALFVTFSTDYVFGGEKRTPYREDDRPFPLQMYGLSKLAGEIYAMSVAPRHAVVIRTCGLYGISGAVSKGGNFVDNRLRDAEATDSLEMSCDQVVCPTSTDDLSRAVLELIVHPRLEPGIYHLVNEGACTWYEFTLAIFEIAGKKVRVTPVDRGGMTGTMRRPLYSVMANTKARGMGIVLPHWRDALERFLAARNDMAEEKEGAR